MTRTSVAVGLAAIVALTALAFMVWPDDGKQGTTNHPAEITPAASPPAAALRHDGESSAAHPPTAAPTRTAADALDNPKTATVGSGLRVRVVDAVGPVAHAAVWIAVMDADLDAAMRGADARVGQAAGGADPLAPLRARPVLFTNAAGEVDGSSIPDTGRFVVAASDAAEASASRRLGWRRLDRAQLADIKLIVVTIDARTAVTLRVRTAEGTPRADIPLRIGLPSGGWLTPLWHSATGSDGSATVHDLAPRARAFAGTESFAALRAIAYVDAPLGVRPRAEIAPAALPAEPIDLVLPPTGSLRVDLDQRGAVPVRAAQVSVEEIGLTEDERRLVSAQGIAMQEGSARFPLVGLHLRLKVTVRIAGASQARVVEVAGPIGAGEERRVVVPVIGDANVIAARLLDPDGKPLFTESFALRVRAQQGGTSNESSTMIESDADARVRIGQEDKLDDGAERSLELRHHKRDLSVTIQVAKPWPKGETDLGDLRMEAAPLLVSGLVVDGDDKPIADADVSVDEVDDASARTAADGSFTIRSRSPVTATTLHASARAFLPSGAIKIAAGTRDLRVRLGGAGVLQGELLLDQVDVRVYLFVTTRERRTQATESEEVWGNSFELTHVVPGTHDVSIRVAGVVAPVAQARDIVVTAGSTTKLPPFDLRGQLRKIAFRVIDEHGVPLRDANALMTSNVAANTAAAFEGVLIRDGHGMIVAAKSQVDLLVFALGRRTEFVPSIQDGQQVTLIPAPIVVVRVPTATLPTPPLLLLVQIESLEGRFPSEASYVLRGGGSVHSSSGGRPWEGDQTGLVDAGGQARIPVNTTGRQRVRCWVARNQEKGMQQAEVEGVTPTEITLRDNSDGETLDVTFTADAVARAAARLRR